MELIWTSPAKKQADTFNNASQPYAHYWLDDHEAGCGPECVEAASGAQLDVTDLVDRVFNG